MIRFTLFLVSTIASAALTQAFCPPLVQSATSATTTALSATQIDTSFMWNRGLNFGKGDFKFYSSFDDMMSVFPEEDRAAYPEVFTLPKGVYEVALTKPLGIVFEEIDAGRGLYVQDLVPDGNAARSGKIQPGDVLVGMTAVKIVGAKYERRMIPARNFDFDTMVGAVSSNEPKWGCNDVVLMFERPDECDSKMVDDFMDFFEPPFDKYENIKLRESSDSLCASCIWPSNLTVLLFLLCNRLYTSFFAAHGNRCVFNCKLS